MSNFFVQGEWKHNLFLTIFLHKDLFKSSATDVNLKKDILDIVTIQNQKFCFKVMDVSLSLNGYRYNSTEPETGLTVQSGENSRGRDLFQQGYSD